MTLLGIVSSARPIERGRDRAPAGSRQHSPRFEELTFAGGRPPTLRVASYPHSLDPKVTFRRPRPNIPNHAHLGYWVWAGVASGLLQNESITFGNFFEAIKTARIWAAQACKTLGGGAADAPSRQKLREYEQEILSQQLESVQIKSKTESELLLKLLDKAYL